MNVIYDGMMHLYLFNLEITFHTSCKEKMNAGFSDFTDVETFISLKVSSLEEVFQWKYNICLVVGKRVHLQ